VIIGTKHRCDWPNCPATIEAPNYAAWAHDYDWEWRDNGHKIVCPTHRFKSTEELQKALAVANAPDDTRDLEPENRLADVICPQCRKPFRLVWNDYTKMKGEWAKQTLIITECPSGGVFAVSIDCPHCDYVEEL
jgi:ssDNA-binding Zn-finger/Zn-ribbon topoisomerase 1